MIDNLMPSPHRALRLEVLALILVVAGIASTVSAMTADQLVARNIKARGGNEKLRFVQSMRMSGRITLGGMEGSVTMIVKRPCRSRVEASYQGMTIVQGFDGQHGWLIGPEGPQAMPEDEERQMRDQADFDGPFVDYKKKGNTLALVGREELDGVDAYKIEVREASGRVSHDYVDARTYLEIRSDDRSSREGVDIESWSLFGDYRKVRGVMLPHSLEFGAKGSPIAQRIMVEKWELDVDLADTLFALPPGIKPGALSADSTGSATDK